MRAPRLNQVTAVHIEPAGAATIQFTVQVPEAAGSELRAITIQQLRNRQVVNFDPEQSRAFLGQGSDRGPEIAIASVDVKDQAKVPETNVVFQEPVATGQTVTLALQAERNPFLDGIYQFGVIAAPIDEKFSSLYLGTGRVTFYGQQ